MLRAKSGRKGSEGQQAWAISQVGVLAEASTPLAQILRFFYVLRAIELEPVCGRLGRQGTAELFDIGTSLLTVQGIGTSHGKLSYRYGELYSALAAVTLRDGEIWRSAGALQVAVLSRSRGTNAKKRTDEIEIARQALRLGHAHVALAAALRAATEASTPDEVRSLTLLQTAAARLTGRSDKARVFIQSLPAKAADTHDQVRWERLLLEVAAKGVSSEVTAIVKAGTRKHPADIVLSAMLLAAAGGVPIAEVRRPVRTSEAFRRRRLATDSTWTLRKTVQVVLDAHDDAGPLSSRVEAIAATLGQTDSLTTFDQELHAGPILAARDEVEEVTDFTTSRMLGSSA